MMEGAALNPTAEPTVTVRSPPIPAFYEEPTSVHRAREILAYALFLLFAGSLIAALFNVDNQDSWSRTKEFLQIAVPAEIGLLGAVIGFYFGSESASRDAR